MQRHLFIIVFILGCTTGNITSTHPEKDKYLKSSILEQEIKTVRLYPNLGDPYQELLPAVVKMGETNLILEFDDLVENMENYFVRLIHCNADWQPSRLSPLQYLDEFNEFPINNFEFSSGTKIPYVHYKFQVPQVKISGNYILEVYRNSVEETVFRQRIMYFQPAVRIASEDLSAAFTTGRINQRINFTIEHSNYELVNPLERVNVVIRQNQRWDNSLYNLKPTIVRQERHELEYQYFDDQNIFSGGNEFRAFDLRSLNSAGANIQRIEQQRDTVTAILMQDKPREYEAYSLDRDLNGNYVIMNYDPGNDTYEANYVKVIFTLKTGRKFLGDIYLHGALTNWETDPGNKMQYYENIKGYQKSLLLKQGWYNYQYLLKNDTLKSDYLEGRHFETENFYEIFVYYRSINLDADVLIGYTSWTVNPQY
ncbi:MAG: DUF5103 domain-containing protein [Candidatus Cyclobacteriaceae bacterium M2_1C_046]